MAVAEHGTEGGFGSGLRAKLQGDTAEPRSPGEAIAAAEPVNPDSSDVDSLRAELSASRAREHGLRASLHDQIDASGHEPQMTQELAEQSAALDRRAAALAQTEADLDERERRLGERFAELDGLLEEKEQMAHVEARLAEREQLIELRVQELKAGDEERAKATAELNEKLEETKKREQELAQAESRVSSSSKDAEA